jgi:hypothetical protein
MTLTQRTQLDIPSKGDVEQEMSQPDRCSGLFAPGVVRRRWVPSLTGSHICSPFYRGEESRAHPYFCDHALQAAAPFVGIKDTAHLKGPMKTLHRLDSAYN